VTGGTWNYDVRAYSMWGKGGTEKEGEKRGKQESWGNGGMLREGRRVNRD